MTMDLEMFLSGTQFSLRYQIHNFWMPEKHFEGEKTLSAHYSQDLSGI